MTPHLIEVGQPLDPNNSNWPHGLQFNIRNAACELLVIYPNITPQEVHDFRTGTAQFGLYETDQVIFLSIKFGSQPYSDAPFSIHRVNEAERKIPTLPANPNERLTLTVITLDGNGIVHGIRFMTFSPAFSVKLIEAIKRQAAEPYNARRHDSMVNLTYASYTSDEIAAMCDVTCTGGD